MLFQETWGGSKCTSKLLPNSALSIKHAGLVAGRCGTRLLLAQLLHLLHGHIVLVRLCSLLALTRQLGLPFWVTRFRFLYAVLFVAFDFTCSVALVCTVYLLDWFRESVICVTEQASSKRIPWV